MSDTERLREEQADIIDTDTDEAEKTAEEIPESASDTADVSESEEGDPAEQEAQIDYAALAEEDMRYLITLFPSLAGKRSVAELDNPLRYAALRDLGLSPVEAYLATNYKVRTYDNRSHLQSAVPKRASAPAELLGSREMEAARELFAGLSDREIQRLYKKVSK